MLPPFKLGICILNWNAGAHLVTCVRTLLSAAQGFDHTIVVVDNNSDDGSLSALCFEFPWIATVQTRANLGYAKGNNVGAAYLRDLGCSVLLFVNPDVSIEQHSVVGLLNTLFTDPTVACVGGIPITNAQVSKIACRTKPSLLDLLMLYGPLSRLPMARHAKSRHFVDPRQLRDGAPVYAISGACMMFRADRFAQVHGFDENTFLYFEEFIIASKLLALEWKTAICTAAPYTHLEAHSTDRVPYRRRLHFIVSEQYYLRAYRGLSWPYRALWRAYRYLEWLPQSAHAHLRNRRLTTVNLRRPSLGGASR